MPYGSETASEGLLIPKAGQGQSSVQLYGIGLGFLRWVGKREADPTLKLDASLFTVDTFKAYPREASPGSTTPPTPTSPSSMRRDKADDFYRLYLFPGVNHSGGTKSTKDTKASASASSTAPTVEYTRPVYPYPQLVAYDGSGDKKNAANSRAYTPDELQPS
ncbi:hypothetical protein [Streptomyces sp. NPDC101455]|uniref:hypothetical protein n=1 Tax=Streptomyces sp. NPDC101455 TaxID=3366142 RepID=UPI00381515DA